MAKVLVTQGEAKQTLGIVRGLGTKGHEIGVISMGRYSIHGFAVASFSKYCKRHHKVSTYTNEEQFITELIAILKKNHYDIVIPVGAPFVGWLTKNRNRIEGYAKIPFPEYERIMIFEDKMKTADLAKNIGVPIPMTIYPSDIDQLTEIAATLNYPQVIKANKEVGGNIVDYAANPEELIKKFNHIVTKYKLQHDLPMVQEYLTGRGAGFFALYKNGVCQQQFTHRRIREFPVSGGASCCAESFQDDQLTIYGKQILDYAKWNGVAMVEFKYNGKGRPYLLEVNPKFWGSYDLSEKCGAGFAHKLVCSTLGLPFVENEEYKNNIIFSWPFNGDIDHCIKKGGFFKLVWKIWKGKIKTNVSWRDFKPSLTIICNWLTGHFYKWYQKIKSIFR